MARAAGRSTPVERLSTVLTTIGLADLARIATGRRSVVILNYHHVERKAFARHLDFLQERYEIRNLGEVVSPGLRGGFPVRPGLALTMDDGYRDNYDQALPELKARGLSATIFLVTSYVGTGRRLWWDRLDEALVQPQVAELQVAGKPLPLSDPAGIRRTRTRVAALAQGLPHAEAMALLDDVFAQLRAPEAGGLERSAILDWSQVEEMSRNGIGFGSHTLTHPILSRLDEAAARNELEASRNELIDRLGTPPSLLAYPHGQAGDIGEVIPVLARQAGYRGAVTTIGGRFRPTDNAFMIPRISVNPDESMDVLALKAGGVWPWIARTKAALARAG